MEIAERRHQQERYRLASRRDHPADTVVTVGGTAIGGGHFALIGGPCSVESWPQIMTIARQVKEAGATLLRGGIGRAHV